MNSAEITTFFNKCQNHDWYYSESDDFFVYDRGKEAAQRLQEEAKTNEKKAIIYKKWHDYYFTGPNWRVSSIRSPLPRLEDFI